MYANNNSDFKKLVHIMNLLIKKGTEYVLKLNYYNGKYV